MSRQISINPRYEHLRAFITQIPAIMDEQGTCWALETNTIQGMTKTSLLPETARVSGMSFAALCTYLIECAFEAKNN